MYAGDALARQRHGLGLFDSYLDSEEQSKRRQGD